jgi:hypothetical protein
MIRPLRLLLAAALLAAVVSPAMAQSTLLQGGSWSTGRVPMYVGQTGGQTIVQDSGPASGGGPGIGVSELNITARGTGTAPYAGQGTGPNGEVACIFDAPTTNATGYHSLCLSANVSSGGLISYQANGAASALPFNFKINGVVYEFPFLTTGVVGPASSTIGNAACWNNTSGTLLADCGAFVTVGGSNTWTGTNNFTSTFQIGGVTQTFPASGNLVGTSDTQTLTNKSIAASQINSGTLPGTVMPAYTGDVTSSAGATVNTIAANAVSNAKLATSTQNTVKGAATSTAVADLTMPSCSAAANALQWVTSTGFQCGTLGATTAGWGVTLSGGGVFSISTSAPPFGFDMPVNLGFTASVGASALTINVRTAAGNAPSATDPVLIPFRSTTLATGTVSWAAITGALSIVVPSAATLGTTNNVPFRIWIFATYNAGVPQLGVALCSVQATTVILHPCSSWEYSRKTTIGIDGFSTSSGVLYATAAVSNDAVRLIGYAEYSAGLATAGSYASTPTTLQVMGPNIPRPGSSIQTVTDSTTTPGTTTSGTYVALTSGQSVAITPTSTVNPVIVTSVSTIGLSTAANGFVRTVRGGSTVVGNETRFDSSGTDVVPSTMMAYDNPQSTSAQTYSFQGLTNAGTLSYPSAGTIVILNEIMGFDLREPANDNIHPGMFTATG